MKIAAWNVNSLRVRLPHLLDWLGKEQPDVIVLQETKVEDKDFPEQAIADAGYKSVYAGQKTYNGVAILSRDEVTDVVADIPDFEDPQRRVLAATCHDVRVIDVYVPNGQSVGSDKYAYKLEWLQALTHYIQTELQRYPRLVVLGDFNIAPEDRDVHDPAQWEDSVLCSEQERAALNKLLDKGMVDSFRLFDQQEGLYSWWDYRMQAFRRKRGLRIDLILASNELAAQCNSSAIDKTPRALERPSDHAPVVAVFSDGQSS